VEYKRYLEDQQEFKIVDIIQDLREDQSERQDWDVQATDGWRIRNNQLPTTESIDNLKNFKGKWFVDNWVKKSFQWLRSYFTGADLFADVKSYDGIIEPNMELLENEVNFSMTLTNIQNIAAEAVEDKNYVGYGVVRSYFDPRRINAFWKTGTPMLEHIDARNVWFKKYGDRIARIFHAEAVDTEKLREQVRQYDPDLADTIKEDEGSDGHVKFPNVKGRTIVYTGVYCKTIRTQKREFIYEFTDYETGEQKEENWLEFEEEWQEMKGEDLPEGVYVADSPIDVDIDCYFQVMFIPSQAILIKQPIVQDGKTVWKEAINIGEYCNYHFLLGSKQNESNYPYGDAYDMKDILDLSVVFMSSLAKQIGNMNRPQPQIFEDAIVNLNEFMNAHWKSDFTTILDPEFFRENPNISPDMAVNYKQTPINDRLFLVMQNYITEAIKSSTGAIDSARGEQQYSGQSGVLANQLQMASQTYLKSDENLYRAFIDSILNWLMHTIVEYRQFAHTVKGLDANGMPTARDVNTTLYNTLKDDDYFVEANMQPNPEQQKQIERQQVMELLAAGKFPLRAALQVMDISTINVDRVMEELDRERGVDQIVALMEEYPELPQIIQQYVQTQQGGQGAV
jgi:hypothetical protein